MRTEELIARLASEAQPVQPIGTLSSRLLRWLLAAAVPSAVMILAARPRPDVLSALGDPGYLVTTTAIVALSVASAAAALSFSVPDDRRPLPVVVAPLAAAVSWVLIVLASLIAGGSALTALASEPVHVACLLQISAVALVPAVVLVAEIRRAAPLRPMWTGVLALAASLGAGAISAAVICPIDRAAHQAWWHLLPVVALAGAGALVGRIWLDRFRGR